MKTPSPRFPRFAEPSSSLETPFIDRDEIVEDLLGELRHSQGKRRVQHHLIEGPAGAGKTTLLGRLHHGIESPAAAASVRRHALELTHRRLEVASTADALLVWVSALAKQHPGVLAGLNSDIERLARQSDDEIVHRATAILENSALFGEAGLVLLIDDFDDLLDRIGPEGSWAVRGLLNRASHITLIASARPGSHHFYQYQHPFFEFFRVHVLRDLTLDETQRAVASWAGVLRPAQAEAASDIDPRRVELLHFTAGGGPRIVERMATILSAPSHAPDPVRDFHSLCMLIDRDFDPIVTALPHQAQKTLSALASAWHPAIAAEVGVRARLETNQASAQLDRLVKQGFAEKVPYYEPEARVAYQVADRCLGYWLMNRLSCAEPMIMFVRLLKWTHGRESWESLMESLEQSSGWPEAYHEVAALAQNLSKPPNPSVAERMADAIDRRGMSLYWPQVREALATIASGTPKYLRRLAPELRRSVVRWLDFFGFDRSEHNPEGSRAPSSRSKRGVQ